MQEQEQDKGNKPRYYYCCIFSCIMQVKKRKNKIKLLTLNNLFEGTFSALLVSGVMYMYCLEQFEGMLSIAAV